jgi:hypothetical protein
MVKSKKIGWAGYGKQMGEMRNAYKILVQKPEKEEAAYKTKA